MYTSNKVQTEARFPIFSLKIISQVDPIYYNNLAVSKGCGMLYHHLDLNHDMWEWEPWHAQTILIWLALYLSISDTRYCTTIWTWTQGRFGHEPPLPNFTAAVRPGLITEKSNEEPSPIDRSDKSFALRFVLDKPPPGDLPKGLPSFVWHGHGLRNIIWDHTYGIGSYIHM